MTLSLGEHLLRSESFCPSVTSATAAASAEGVSQHPDLVEFVHQEEQQDPAACISQNLPL